MGLYVKSGSPYIVYGLLFNVLTLTYLDVRSSGRAPGTLQVVEYSGIAKKDDSAVRPTINNWRWFSGGSSF